MDLWFEARKWPATQSSYGCVARAGVRLETITSVRDIITLFVVELGFIICDLLSYIPNLRASQFLLFCRLKQRCQILDKSELLQFETKC